MITLRQRYMYRPTCKECMQHNSNCGGKNVCTPIKRKLRSYNGIRLTADGFDCALPLTIDSHSKCSYACIYCLDGDTLITKSDLTSIALKDIKVGDSLLGLNTSKGFGSYSLSFAPSKVLNKWEKLSEVYEIELCDGRKVLCSADHRWLSNRGWKYTIGKKNGLNCRPYLTTKVEIRGLNHAITTPELTEDYKKGYLSGIIRGDGHLGIHRGYSGWRIRKGRKNNPYYRKETTHHIFMLRMNDQEALDRAYEYLLYFGVITDKYVYTEKMNGIRTQNKENYEKIVPLIDLLDSSEYKRGFLAGIFDAGGSFSWKSGSLYVANKDSLIIDFIEKSLVAFGFSFTTKERKHGVKYVRINGGVKNIIRFFQLTNTAIGRKKSLDGYHLRGSIKIKSIRSLCYTDILYDIETTTGNFIANGLVSHNCFSPNISGHREGEDRIVGQTSLMNVEALFSGRGKGLENFFEALKYKNRINGYPCPVQLGGLTDPLDNIERNQGWFLEFARIAKKYNQPVRISTKGNLFLEDEYLKAIADKPELFWVNFSIISPDNKLMKQVDIGAPSPSERIQCIKNLTEIKVKAGLRFRPIIPGISDATPDYPKAYSDLINMVADAGARNISYEVAFLPMLDPKVIPKWEKLEALTGIPYLEIYRKFGKVQPCTRPSYEWTEQIMHAIYKVAKSRGMYIGVSDPVWKELNDGGCCCGISKDDPVFGNWQRESATNQLVEARDTGKLLTSKDVIPSWAKTTKADQMYRPAIGPTGATFRQYFMWSDKMQEQWNDLSCDRGPLQYFQGALRPIERKEDGTMVFKYVGLERKYSKQTQYWNIIED